MKLNTTTVLKFAAAAAVVWAIFRVWQARKAGVPLDLAFKHPTSSVFALRNSIPVPGMVIR